eukprot:191614-Chlamydomonas_euryale.AAC.5
MRSSPHTGWGVCGACVNDKALQRLSKRGDTSVLLHEHGGWLYGFAWACMCVWACTDALGRAWVRMGVHGCAWARMGAHGRAWVHMGAYGCTWARMGALGCACAARVA